MLLLLLSIMPFTRDFVIGFLLGGAIFSAVTAWMISRKEGEQHEENDAGHEQLPTSSKDHEEMDNNEDGSADLKHNDSKDDKHVHDGCCTHEGVVNEVVTGDVDENEDHEDDEVNEINDYLIPSTRTPNTDDRELKVMTVMDATQHEPGVTEETSQEKEVYLEYDDSWWLEENNGEKCLEKIDGIGDLFVA